MQESRDAITNFYEMNKGTIRQTDIPHDVLFCVQLCYSILFCLSMNDLKAAKLTGTCMLCKG